MKGERKNGTVSGMPIWIRPPKSGNEFYTGISRAKLHDLAKAGKIRTSSVREPGTEKGTRLYHLGSILELIESSEEKLNHDPNLHQQEGGRGQQGQRDGRALDRDSRHMER